MLYAISEIELKDVSGVKRTHRELLSKFTGQLRLEDLDYFRKWDRLIDLEAHATLDSIATAWLLHSGEREQITGETMSSLVYDGASPGIEGSGALLRFRRSPNFRTKTQLDSLSIGKGSHVVVSTDGRVFDDSQSDLKPEYINTQRERKKFRHQMCVVRGFLEEASSDEVIISAKREDLDRVRELCNRFKKFSGDDAESTLRFRVDKDNSAVGIGTLRQNLINFFTADHARNSNEELTPLENTRQRRLPRLRDFIVRLDAPSFGPIDDKILFRARVQELPGCNIEALSEEFRILNEDQQKAIRKVSASFGRRVLIARCSTFT